MLFRAFDWFMLVFLIIIVSSVALNVVHVRKGIKQFGRMEFKIRLKVQNYMKIIVLTLIIIALSELATAIIAADLKLLFSLLIMALAAFIYFLNNRFQKGISENGLLIWGGFISWNQIKKCTFKDDVITLTISNMSKRFELEYDIDIIYDLNQKSKIIALMSRHIEINTMNVETPPLN